MTLECLGSSSKGNCYLLRASDGVLVIECGVPFLEVKKALDWKTSDIVGCIVSHEHNDHAQYISEYVKCGIKVMALAEVFESKHLSDNVFAHAIKPKHGYKIGGFRVFPLFVTHDVPCLAFVVEHAEMGKLLFATDTMMIPYKINGLNHIMIEANYSDEILYDNIAQGIVSSSMRSRLLHSHMEIGATLDFLQRNDISNVSEIILLHLSANNADSNEFAERVMKCIGLPTYIAQRSFKTQISADIY